MSKARRWLTLAIVSSALFLIVMDMTVLYTALPRLTHDLQATASEKLWIVNIYSLVTAGLLLGTGTFGDRIGHRKLFLAGLVTFGVATLIAAFAQTPLMLIFGRVILAIGAALMMPATLSLIRLTFEDKDERSLAIGVWAAVASGGAGLGPLIGGFLLEHFWWGSVFLINLPVVIVALIMTLLIIPDSDGQPDKPWDLISSLQIMVGLIGVAYAIKEISKQNASIPIAIITLIIGVIGIWLFVRRQRALPYPLVDFSLFRNSKLTAGVITATTASLTQVGLQLVFTQRLQLVLNMSPLEAGTMVIMIPIASFFAGIFTGWLLSRVRIERVLTVALLLSGIGLGIFLFVYEAPIPVQMMSLLFLGLGLGSATTAASNAIMGNAPEERAGMAASVEEVSYELGGAIGVAVLGSIMSAVYTATLIIPEALNVPSVVRDSLDEARLIAESLPQADVDLLIPLANAAFDQGFVAVIAVATIGLLLASATVWQLTRREPVNA